MFANLLSTHRSERAATPNHRLVRRLDAALAKLPSPWQVLRNRRPSAADGPPWAKYIALHPEKGIALIDLLPANPHAAIGPLDDFLARTGFMAFSRGDPPIVAVALMERDIPAVADCLSDAFAAAPRCGIKNASWTDAAMELLVSTPGLLLTPIERDSDQAKGDRPKHDQAKRAETPPVADREVKARSFAGKPAQARPAPEHQPPVEVRPSGPSRRSEPDTPPEPRLRIMEEGDWRDDRMTSFEHRRQQRGRRVVPWLLAASLGAGIAIAIYYPHLPGKTPAPAEPPDEAQPQIAAASSTDAVKPLPPEESQTPSVTALPNSAPVKPSPPEESQAPQTAASPNTAPIKPSPPDANQVAGSNKNRPASAVPTPPPPAIATLEPSQAKTAAPMTPDTGKRADLGSPAPTSASKVASAPPPTPTPAPVRRAKEAPTPLILHPPRDSDADLPQTALAAPTRDTANPKPDPANDETVTIDGTTYIKGREPHALGTLTDAAPAPAGDAIEPAPPSSSPSSYDNQVLIQPE